MKKSVFIFSKKASALFFTAMACCMIAVPASAQNVAAGATALTEANVTVRAYFPQLVLLAYGIAAIFAVIGLVKLFTQWNSGEGNVGKSVGAWLGSAIALVIGINLITTLFGI